jgi:rhodanese-related sulfurtransferase
MIDCLIHWQDTYLIDVREPDEVLQGSIPSSVNMPLSVLSSDLHLTLQAFKGKYGFDKPQKAQEIVFYCRSGKRSASAADVAKRNGYTKWALIFCYLLR